MAVEIEYANRTAANILRAPIFKGVAGAPRRLLAAPAPVVDSSDAVAGQIEAAKTKATLRGDGWEPVSYTHLDVYKRQVRIPVGPPDIKTIYS